jgi:hypothetical protein
MQKQTSKWTIHVEERYTCEVADEKAHCAAAFQVHEQSTAAEEPLYRDTVDTGVSMMQAELVCRAVLAVARRICELADAKTTDPDLSSRMGK